MANTKHTRRVRRKSSIRRKVNGTADRPRLSVYKSNTAIYAQLIDDTNGHTLLQVSSSFGGGTKANIKVEDAKKVGLDLAEKAKGAGVEAVIFDRNGSKYHGKIKALAEGAREGGLKF